MRLSRITHKNKIIETKVNYFAQYFRYVSHKIGTIESVPLETPLSIFENISVQLTKNINNSSPYLAKYFENRLIKVYNYKTGKRLIRKFNELVLSYSLIEEERLRRKWLKTNCIILVDLCGRIISRLKMGLFKENVNSLISVLGCDHELCKHKGQIIFYTNFIVCDFLLNDFSKEDLVKIFDFIMSSDKSKFPFDKRLFFKVDKNRWDDIMTQALENRTFTQQFQGISNFRFKHKTTAHFLFKVYGLYLAKDDRFEHDGVILISSNSKELNKIKQKEGPLVRNYFSNPSNFCVAILKRTYRSENHAINSCSSSLRCIIDFINRTLEYNLVVDSKDLIITKDFIDFRGTIALGEFSTPRNFEDREFKKVKRFMEGHKFEKRTFNYGKYRSIYNDAILSKKHYDLWIYIEAMHKDLILNVSPKKIIDSIVTVLLSSYFKRYRYRIKLSLWSAIMANSDIYGFSDIDYENNRYFETFDLDLVNKQTKSEFVKELITNSKYKKKDINPALISTFYKDLFLELYELRNHYVHAGEDIRNLKIKLDYSIRNFIEIYEYEILKLLGTKEHLEVISKYQSILSQLNKENSDSKVGREPTRQFIG